MRLQAADSCIVAAATPANGRAGDLEACIVNEHSGILVKVWLEGIFDINISIDCWLNAARRRRILASRAQPNIPRLAPV